MSGEMGEPGKMGEILNISLYRRTCENCVFWRPPEYKGAALVRDSKCEHIGGWTPVFYGRGPNRKMMCLEFKRKN